MNAADMLAFMGALLVMLLGLLGSVVPGLPGTPLILAAALIHRLVRGDAGASGWVLAIMAGLTLASPLLRASVMAWMASL